VSSNEDAMDRTCSRHGKYEKRIKAVSLEDIGEDRIDNIKMDLKETGCEKLDCIHLA
jgi:hypothetical protein